MLGYEVARDKPRDPSSLRRTGGPWDHLKQPCNLLLCQRVTLHPQFLHGLHSPSRTDPSDTSLSDQKCKLHPYCKSRVGASTEQRLLGSCSSRGLVASIPTTTSSLSCFKTCFKSMEPWHLCVFPTGSYRKNKRRPRNQTIPDNLELCFLCLMSLLHTFSL